MKKALNILFVMFLLSGTLLFAANEMKVEIPVNDFDPNNSSHYSGSFSDDMWDLQFSYDVDTPSGLTGISGAETDGTYLYGTKWAGTEIVKFDLQGNFIETFTIPGVSALRDLAYDGTYFYGSNASNYIWEMDFDTQTLISTITTPGSVRSIAYDSDLDGFWYNNFSTDLHFVDRSGTLLNTIATPPSMYGCAYDNYTAGGPYLWIFTGTSTGQGCQVEQYDLNTLALTGETHSVSGDLGAVIAGGLFLESDLIPGKITLGGLAQGSPDLLFGYEIGDSAPLDAPGAPTDVVVTPDVGGALEAVIDWVCPDLTVGGATLTDLDEMEVYRDDVLIYTDSSPTIGGAGSYTDAAVPASGIYTYKVVGVNSVGEGIPVVIATWVGEDVPNVVTDLLLVQTTPGVLSGTLTWVNPTTGLNGGAFNNAILGYHIERSDGVVFEATGLLTEYVDGTIPSAGNYFYTVQPYNSVGDGGIETSNVVLIADAGLLLMEGFDDGVIPAGWNIVGAGQTNWSISTTANAGGTSPELQFSWTPSFVDVSRMVTQELDTSGMTQLSLEFKHFLNDFSGTGYSIGFQTTSDGTTWNDVVVYDPTGDIGPETVIETFTNADVGSATFQLAVYFNGDSYNLDYWYVDDLMLINAGAGPDPGTIEGTVTLDGGTGDVEDVEVTAGGITVNPDGNGDYEISLTPGTYDVIGSLAGYEDGTELGVIVTEGNATTGVDLTLTYITTTFDPPVNLAVDENNLFTWEAPGGGGALIELVQHDGNAANAYYQDWDSGYGVIYDLSGYDNVTVEMVDFRHSSWGITGTWDYSIHIVDWDTYTEITEVTGLQTTVNDDWELEIDLGSVSASGLVGIFLEPMGNAADDAYPDLDSDNVGPDGLSYYGPLADYSAMALSDIGDFLMDLWIMGEATDGIVKAKKFEANFGNGIARNGNLIPNMDFATLNQTSRELESYDVYLDGDLEGNTTDLFWQFTDLVNGQDYEAGVVAIYTDGESDMATILFNATSDANNIIVASTTLNGNYPNPFNPVTNIAYSIKEAGNVTLEVYNLRGQLVKTLVNDVREVGLHTEIWNGKDNTGKSVSSGVYFYKMKTSNYTATKKMILMK